MNIFCPKCGSSVMKVFWHDKIFYRCISNPSHFFSEDMMKAVAEGVSMTLGFMSLGFGEELEEKQKL